MTAHPPGPQVRRYRPPDRATVLAAVVSAFAEDPLFQWVWPDRERYAELATDFFGLLLEARIGGGEVWVADGGAASAMWNPPGGLYEQLPEDAWPSLQTRFTPAEQDRWASYDAAVQVPEDAGPHWYLGVLATDPERLRTGLASAVLRPVLAAADRTGTPAYLETAAERNLAFYAHQGFHPVHEANPPGGPRCWVLRREPEPAP